MFFVFVLLVILLCICYKFRLYLSVGYIVRDCFYYLKFHVYRYKLLRTMNSAGEINLLTKKKRTHIFRVF